MWPLYKHNEDTWSWFYVSTHKAITTMWCLSQRCFKYRSPPPHPPPKKQNKRLALNISKRKNANILHVSSPFIPKKMLYKLWGQEHFTYPWDGMQHQFNSTATLWNNLGEAMKDNTTANWKYWGNLGRIQLPKLEFGQGMRSNNPFLVKCARRSLMNTNGKDLFYVPYGGAF